MFPIAGINLVMQTPKAQNPEGKEKMNPKYIGLKHLCFLKGWIFTGAEFPFGATVGRKVGGNGCLHFSPRCRPSFNLASLVTNTNEVMRIT